MTKGGRIRNMRTVKYQLIPEELETDEDEDEFIQVEGMAIPRIGETVNLDHHEFSGDYRVTNISYGITYKNLHPSRLFQGMEDYEDGPQVTLEKIAE